MKNKTLNISIIIGLFIIIINLIIIIKPFRINNYKTYSNITNNYSNTIAVKIENDNGEYESSDSIPTSGYALNTDESYCGLSNGDGTYTKDDNITIKYQNGTISLGKMTKRKTKCFLYFDIYTVLAGEYILAQNTVNTTTPDFSVVSTTNDGIYTAEDNDGTSYYYRGAVDNNYFYFAGFYWRIIRINGDGTIRLIYQGTSATATGDATVISSSVTFNSNNSDNAYVGYKYTLNELHGTNNDSNIKTVVDSWYNDNLSNYKNYIDTNVGFCNDREVSSGTGLGTTTTEYAGYNRLANNKTPSLKCTNSNDLLKELIGLITADEVSFAGGLYVTNNTNYYLYSGQAYWTMTSYNYNSLARCFYVNADGWLGWYNVKTSFGVRPVINIRKDVELEGTGTSSDPYKIK